MWVLAAGTLKFKTFVAFAAQSLAGGSHSSIWPWPGQHPHLVATFSSSPGRTVSQTDREAFCTGIT